MLSKLLHKIFTFRSKPEHIRLGQRGETLAAGYLRRQAKMRILKRNYRDNAGEIDIIAQDGPELVFIEVKTRSREGVYTAEQAVDAEKQRHIIRTARSFINRFRLQKHPCRYDIVAVILNPGEKTQIRHTRDAFGKKQRN
ncbi:MAG: YraN family protein [Sedimentisphaerales bacterium]|nr:YraN family protein [Sedimentisphaerales bacterium]MBN2844150.1 YraN family protein [Sedimentisphaerales bacterium]